jgi:hypothetical protein
MTLRKNAAAILLPLLLISVLAKSQNENTDAVKLFVDWGVLKANNPMDTDEKILDRLYDKTKLQLSQTGVAETGYSNFLVVPVFDVISTSLSQNGIENLYLAECELTIFIQRRPYGAANTGAATFASFTKKIFGSAATKNGAIENALNNIKYNESSMMAFFENARKKITDYFKSHCKEVIAEASSAKYLDDHAKAIALLFSIPSNAPCIEDAKTMIKDVYQKYVEGECDRVVFRMQGYVARAQNTDDSSNYYYGKIVSLIEEFDPNTPVARICYDKIKKEFDKIEGRFNEKQRQEWEVKKKQLEISAENSKDVLKLAAKVATSYQPPASINISNTSH